MPEAALGIGDGGLAGETSGGGAAAAAAFSVGSRLARRLAKSWGLPSGVGGAAGAAGFPRADASWTLGAGVGSSLAGTAGGDSACANSSSDGPQAREEEAGLASNCTAGCRNSAGTDLSQTKTLNQTCAT